MTSIFQNERDKKWIGMTRASWYEVENQDIKIDKVIYSLGAERECTF